MAKINLVIADTDCHYVEGFVRFLSENYGQELQISYFTESIYLSGYLSSNEVKTDILLISPALVADTFDFASVKLVIVLSDGRLESAYKNFIVINKYQVGDKLVGSILDAYAERYPNDIYISSGKLPRVIAMYSPIGGAGKSTLAVAVASRLSGTGKRVLYMNLETVQTTPVFFECSNEKTLSDILYFVRDRHKTLSVKLEGVRQVDPYSGIHYISPPESISDLEETKPEELQHLLRQIRNMGKYDVVVIDMSSSMDDRNLTVLCCCDNFLVPFDQSLASKIRMQAFIRELKLYDSRFQAKLMGKCTLILNRYVTAGFVYESTNIEGKEIEYRLPKMQSLVYQRDNRWAVNLNNDYGEIISLLAERL